MLPLYEQKYSIQNISHLLYSLVYFDDAEKERMPRMLWRIDWRTIKRTIQEWVRELVQ
jgi:hypothetical protein